MGLIKAGVWHTTVWVSRTWPEDLWAEYGTVVIPTGGGASGARMRSRRLAQLEAEVLPLDVLELVKRWLEIKSRRTG